MLIHITTKFTLSPLAGIDSVVLIRYTHILIFVIESLDDSDASYPSKYFP